MRRLPVFLLFLLVLASPLAASSNARACSCLPPPEFAEAFQRSDAIFLGEVLSIESAGSGEYPHAVWAVFRVDRSWKGEPPATTRVLTAASSASCGYPFEPGRRYLVYAFRGVTGWYSTPDDPDALHTGLCWRTHPFSASDPDLLALEWSGIVELRRPFPSPSSGQVEIEYMLGAERAVELRIYDLSGRLVRVLVERATESAGPHRRVWNGRDGNGRAVGAGVYVAVLAAGDRRFERRFALLR